MKRQDLTAEYLSLDRRPADRIYSSVFRHLRKQLLSWHQAENIYAARYIVLIEPLRRISPDDSCILCLLRLELPDVFAVHVQRKIYSLSKLLGSFYHVHEPYDIYDILVLLHVCVGLFECYVVVYKADGVITAFFAGLDCDPVPVRFYVRYDVLADLP